MARPFKKMSPRNRMVTAFSAAGLIAIASLIWATPEVQRYAQGPTDAEIALQREQARATDLKSQLIAAQADNQETASELSKQLADSTARANDLAAQLTQANEKLSEPDENAAKAAQATVQQARADALKKQYDAAQATASQKAKTLSGDAASAQARADDLKRQIDALQAEPVVTASLDKAGILAARKQFGMYTQQSPYSYAEFDLLEATLQRDAQVSGYFGSWANDFRLDAVKAAWSRNQVPLLTWESQEQVGSVGPDQPKFSNGNIIRGDFDAYITKYAQDIVAGGYPMIIRFDQEMNLPSAYPWGERMNDGTPANGNEQGSFIQMWQHVHDIFEANGANNLVSWMWAPNRINQIPNQPKPDAYYPGDSYVDIVGLDAYWRISDLKTDPTFDNTFGMTLPYLRPYGKPIWLAEFGATDQGDMKEAWVQDLFESLQKPENSDIAGMMWFAITVTSNQGTNNWAPNSTPGVGRIAGEGLAASGFGRPYGT